MKKILVLVLIIFGLWYLYDLGQKNQEIQNAKKDLLNDKKSPHSVSPKEREEVTDLGNKDIEDVKNQDKNKPSYKVEKLDENNFIKLDDLSNKVENITDKIKITGKVLDDRVDKIIVKFSNKNSDYPNDEYRLKSFKKGNKNFEYNADSLTFQNLDYGENEYLIEAYIGDEVSKTKLIINIPENFEPKKVSENSDISFDKKVLGDLVISLPEGGNFGKPIVLDDKITYSNIDNLEIKKEDFDENKLQNSNDIWNSTGTGYLNENIDSYVYWNTLRPIDFSNKDSGVSFYILRKSGDKFVYEKLYFDFVNKLKGVLKIEEFPVDKEEKIFEQMSKLNTELKEKNEDLEEVKKADKLFKEIIR